MTKSDLRISRQAILVHPEIEGTLRIEFYENSYRGVARFKGKMYEASLRDLLEQGWIHLKRPDFKAVS